LRVYPHDKDIPQYPILTFLLALELVSLALALPLLALPLLALPLLAQALEPLA
jgi:hypothetical protein